MRFSIITVALNREATIGGAIESVLRQADRFAGFEYIIRDGGSRDGTVSVAESYRGRFERRGIRFSLISEADGGLYDAVNRAVKQARGEIVALLHADDYYCRDDALSLVDERFHASGCDLLYANLLYVDAKNPDRVARDWRSRSYRPGLFKSGWMPPHPTLFVRRELFGRCGCYRTDMKIAADYEFMLRLIERDSLRPEHLDRYLIHMRTGGASNGSPARYRLALDESKRAWALNGMNAPRLFKIRFVLQRLPQLRAAGKRADAQRWDS